MHRLTRYLPLLILCLAQICTGQEAEPKGNIMKLGTAFNTYLETIHPQKIYLQLDKQEYFAPERIWFRAYLLDGRSLRQDALSDHIYVELIDPYQRVVQTIRVKTGMNEGAGDFLLTDTVPAGSYQVRAYSHWMKNFGREYYFTCNIEVRNPMHTYIITAKEAKENQRIIDRHSKQSNVNEMGFFPEGGNLLAGKMNVVGFKAMDGLGWGVQSEGKLFDQGKNLITTFRTEHNGMGTFKFIPNQSMDYTAVIDFENGETEKVKLPVSISSSVGLSISERDTNYIISIKSNKELSADRPANEFTLIGQVSGRIYHQSSSNLIDRDTLIIIEKSKFPSGIIHFTLFNNRQQAVSERLVFNNSLSFIDFEIGAHQDSDSLIISARTKNLSENEAYFDGSISVVLCDTLPEEIVSENIISHLLINSELPGNIESSAYYFSNRDQQVYRHADLLMLTHGWTRYTWRDITSNELPKIKYAPEQGITVAGRITREIPEIPLKDANVSLYIRDRYNDEFQTVSGEGGRFKFDNLNYRDTIDTKIVARKEKGGKGLVIHLEGNIVDEISDFNQDLFLTTNSQIDMKAYRQVQSDIEREKRKQRERELDSIFSQSIHGRPDFVLWGYEIPPGSPNLLEAMKGRIAGVDIIGDEIVIRGVNTFLGSTDPLLIVDNVTTAISYLSSIPVEDVEMVEILKGPSSAMYGARGGNGVIAVYTKRGTFMKKGELSFTMLGYHEQEWFYSPGGKQISRRAKMAYLPLTIYWNTFLKLNNNQTEISIPIKPNRLFKFILIEGIDSRGKIGYAYAVINDN